MSHHLQRLAATVRPPPSVVARPIQTRSSFSLAEEPVTDPDTGAVTCACTTTKIGYGLLGALLGGAAVWLISDSQKTTIKAKTKAGAKSAVAKGKAYAARKRDEKYDRDRERAARGIERKADEYERRGMLQDAKDMRANARYVRST